MKIKKLVFSVLMIVIVLFVYSTGVNATNVSINANQEVKNGKEIVVTISWNEQAYTAGMRVKYDNTKFEYKNCSVSAYDLGSYVKIAYLDTELAKPITSINVTFVAKTEGNASFSVENIELSGISSQTPIEVNVVKPNISVKINNKDEDTNGNTSTGDNNNNTDEENSNNNSGTNNNTNTGNSNNNSGTNNNTNTGNSNNNSNTNNKPSRPSGNNSSSNKNNNKTNNISNNNIVENINENKVEENNVINNIIDENTVNTNNIVDSENVITNGDVIEKESKAKDIVLNIILAIVTLIVIVDTVVIIILYKKIKR